ncbi:MAG: hypothetical protein AAGG69_15680 [Pseudomonadota bacterium]
MKLARIVLTATLGFVLAGAAYAEVKAVKSGTTTAVAARVFYNKHSCAVAPPGDVKILREPKHGKVTVRQIRRKLTGACTSSTGTYNVFYYTPDRGYTGADSFRYSLSFPGNLNREIRGRSATVKISVQ